MSMWPYILLYFILVNVNVGIIFGLESGLFAEERCAKVSTWAGVTGCARARRTGACLC